MASKFTIRDILVYFISGFTFFSVFFFVYPDYVLDKLKLYSEYDSLLGIAMIPIFYILGHFVHGIDVHIVSQIGLYIYKWRLKSKNWFTNLLNQIFNGHRIRGIKDKFLENSIDFENVVSDCSDDKQYEEARYWSYLNDTFKGYIVTFLIFAISCFIRGKYMLAFSLLGLAILFRQRGRFFGTYYIQAIMRINDRKKKIILNTTEQPNLPTPLS